MSRTSVKGQVFADLVVEFVECPEEMNVEKHGIDEKSVGLISARRSSPWEVFVDRGANQGGSRVGLVLVSHEKITIERSLKLGFSAINNEAKYEALLMGIVMVQKMGGKTGKIFSDSKLVVGQVRGELEARDPRMQEYTNKI